MLKQLRAGAAPVGHERAGRICLQKAISRLLGYREDTAARKGAGCSAPLRKSEPARGGCHATAIKDNVAGEAHSGHWR